MNWTPEELEWLQRKISEEWEHVRRSKEQRFRQSSEFFSASDFRLSAALQEIKQLQAQIRQLESRDEAAWAMVRQLEQQRDAAEADAKKAWAEVVRLTLEGSFTFPKDLLKRLISFVHPDKHQKASMAVQLESNRLTVELIKLKNG